MPIQRLPVKDGGTVSMREHQQRMTEVGRIRLGVFNPEGRGRPEKLDRFRFTSTDGDLIAAVAEQYGGRPGQYSPQRSNGAMQWEVITDAREVLVYVPQQRIDPWLEKWKPGMCERRCDGVTETISGQDCFCAARRVAPKDMCKPTVRVQLMLADVPGLGTWRLESHGAYAAGELATLAPLVAALPMPCPAKLMLRQESRSWMEGGERRTTTFYVPWLHISAATPSQLMLGGDALSQALGAASRAAAVEAAPAQHAIEAPPASPPSTPPSTPSATPAAVARDDQLAGAKEGARLSDSDRVTILAKIEEATDETRLFQIRDRLLSMGVKDEQIKQALMSKYGAIQQALQVGGSATGPADTPRATPSQADHQRVLRDTAVRAADPWTALDLRGMTREQFGEMMADPQWSECLNRGASPQAIINEGGPAHWLASDDQARAYGGMPEGDPDKLYPVGSTAEVGGVTLTKHTAVADAYRVPVDEWPNTEPEDYDRAYGNHETGGAPEDVIPTDGGQEYDVDTEFALIYAAAGPFGWTTSQTNEWIKKYCFVTKLGEVTGAKLHDMRMRMQNDPEHFK